MAEAEKTPVIQLIDIRREYKMGEEVIKALNGVNLNIYRNDYVAIMGPSGSGKSTLMNMIGCLDTPSSGAYILNGINVTWPRFATMKSASSSRPSTCCRVRRPWKMWLCR